LDAASPGHHALVSGLRALPLAGDELAVVESEERAKRVSDARGLRSEDYRRAQLAAASYTAKQRQRQMLEVRGLCADGAGAGFGPAL
jgi:hypothetical protein